MKSQRNLIISKIKWRSTSSLFPGALIFIGYEVESVKKCQFPLICQLYVHAHYIRHEVNWTSSRQLSQQKALWHIRHWTKKKIIITIIIIIIIIIIIRSTLRLSVKAASTKWTRLFMEWSMLYLANKEVSPVLHCDKTRRAFENTNEPQASVFYISRVFSNVRSFLWHFNTRLRLAALWCRGNGANNKPRFFLWLRLW